VPQIGRSLSLRPARVDGSSTCEKKKNTKKKLYLRKTPVTLRTFDFSI